MKVKEVLGALFKKTRLKKSIDGSTVGCKTEESRLSKRSEVEGDFEGFQKVITFITAIDTVIKDLKQNLGREKTVQFLTS